MENILTDTGRQVLKTTADPSSFIEELSGLDTRGERAELLSNWGFDIQIDEMLYDKKRDGIIPGIKSVIRDEIQPWLETRCPEFLPDISLERVVGSTNEILQSQGVQFQNEDGKDITAKTIRDVIVDDGIEITFGERKFELTVIMPDVNTKRAIEAATYRSRERNRGVVRKSRTAWKKVPTQLTQMQRDRRLIRFEEVLDEITDLDTNELVPTVINYIPDWLQIPKEKRTDFNEVVDWLKKNGGKQWLTGDFELLLQRLADITNGEEVDCLLWNCLSFESLQQEEMPGSEKTKISSRTDTAIADYFAQDIAETMQQIYRLGNPNFVILVPTNEGLADGLGIWNYDESQPVEVREVLMDETVTLLCPIVDKIQALSGLPIEVKRWDRYIGENFDQNKVTMQGIKLSEYLAETVPEYKSRLLEQAMSITGLDLNEIDSELLKEILQAQIRFNGVYLGEGNLSSGNVIGDRKVMWVNCEGAGVKEAQLLGANGDIAIVTPVKQSRIQEYYEWKRDVINGRG